MGGGKNKKKKGSGGGGGGGGGQKSGGGEKKQKAAEPVPVEYDPMNPPEADDEEDVDYDGGVKEVGEEMEELDVGGSDRANDTSAQASSCLLYTSDAADE